MKKLLSIIFLFSLIFSPAFVAAAPAPAIDYQLPYPGILPGSSLYPLKSLRDKIAGFLIGKPLKKAEFNLIKADVRMSAAVSLLEQKKSVSLIAKTIVEAEDYFNEAVNKTLEAKAQGMDIRDFVKRLSLANQKHKETMEKIEEKIGKKDRKKFELMKKRIETMGIQVKRIR